MNTQQLVRMSRGCGYEPPANGRVHLTVWQPPTGKNGYSGPEMSACPGYTCSLPEIEETALARVHWGKGNAATLGLSEEGEHAVVILEGAYNQLQAWSMTPANEGGGGS